MLSINFDFCFVFFQERIKIDYSVIIKWFTKKIKKDKMDIKHHLEHIARHSDI